MLSSQLSCKLLETLPLYHETEQLVHHQLHQKSRYPVPLLSCLLEVPFYKSARALSKRCCLVITSKTSSAPNFLANSFTLRNVLFVLFKSVISLTSAISSSVNKRTRAGSICLISNLTPCEVTPLSITSCFVNSVLKAAPFI